SGNREEGGVFGFQSSVFRLGGNKEQSGHGIQVWVRTWYTPRLPRSWGVCRRWDASRQDGARRAQPPTPEASAPQGASCLSADSQTQKESGGRVTPPAALEPLSCLSPGLSAEADVQ